MEAGGGKWVSVVFMSFVSTQRSLAFHHEGHGGAQIISVTAPHVRSFTTLYSLLKKKVVPSNNWCCWLAFFFLRLLLLGRGDVKLCPVGELGSGAPGGALDCV